MKHTSDTFHLEPSSARHSHVRQLVLRACVLVGVAGVLAYIFLNRPIDMRIRYEYGVAHHGLVSMTVKYVKDGEDFSRIRFHYASHKAGFYELHDTRLLRGNYHVLIELQYGANDVEALPAGLRPHLKPIDDKRFNVHLERTLHVTRSGEATLAIDDGDIPKP